MRSAQFKFSPAAEAKYRLNGTRKLIASAKILHLEDYRPDPIRMTHEERVELWTAERIARRAV